MKRRHGCTLVELLVVITIIGILVGLLLPAIQSARESGRRTQCANNLRQLTQACIQHESAHQYYPTGGWSGSWSGDPNRGTDHRQPGGWTYNVLPFLEQQNLHDLGLGAKSASLAASLAQAAQTPISGFYCPTRRSAIAYFCSNSTCNINVATTPITTAARTDYAANAGTIYVTTPLTQQGTTTPSLPIAFNFPASGDPSFADVPGYQYPSAAGFNGVIYTCSETGNGEITDGAAFTVMLGEKNLNPLNWTSGMDPADKYPIFAGFSADTERFGTAGTLSPNCAGTGQPQPPRQDRKNFEDLTGFGSAHVDGLNMFMCDGAGHWISYMIDPQTFVLLCGRNDGLTINSQMLNW